MRTTIKIGGTILSALFTIITNVLTVREIGAVYGYDIEWQWFTLGGFIVFLGFVGWWLSDLHNYVRRLESAKPSIEVRPANDLHDYYLEVKNIGSTGTFEAQVELVKGKSYVFGLPQMYSACWDKTNNNKTQIMKGHKDKLKIATLEIPARVLSMSLRFYYYSSYYFEGSYVEGIRYSDSTSWIPGSNQVVVPEFTLRITISSEPSLKEGSFVRNYKLSSSGLEELPNHQEKTTNIS